MIAQDNIKLTQAVYDVPVFRIVIICHKHELQRIFITAVKLIQLTYLHEHAETPYLSPVYPVSDTGCILELLICGKRHYFFRKQLVFLFIHFYLQTCKGLYARFFSVNSLCKPLHLDDFTTAFVISKEKTADNRRFSVAVYGTYRVRTCDLPHVKRTHIPAVLRSLAENNSTTGL